jgi:hypothetical protein
VRAGMLIFCKQARGADSGRLGTGCSPEEPNKADIRGANPELRDLKRADSYVREYDLMLAAIAGGRIL